MPHTPRSQDPYAVTPPTPRQTGSEFNIPSEAMCQSPNSRKPVDQFNQPPGTPRPGEHTQEQFRSPVRGSDPFAANPGLQQDSFGPGAPRSQPGMGPRPPLKSQAMWAGQEQDPYSQPPGTPHPHGSQMPPRFERQLSAPQPSVSSEDHQFNISAPSDHPETSSPVDQFAQPQPHARPPRPHLQRVTSMPGVEGHMLPGQQFRHPFRPPHPGMMRPPGMPPEIFQQQVGPRPRMDMPPHPGLRHPESSAVSFEKLNYLTVDIIRFVFY